MHEKHQTGKKAQKEQTCQNPELGVNRKTLTLYGKAYIWNDMLKMWRTKNNTITSLYEWISHASLTDTLAVQGLKSSEISEAPFPHPVCEWVGYLSLKKRKKQQQPDSCEQFSLFWAAEMNLDFMQTYRSYRNIDASSAALRRPQKHSLNAYIFIRLYKLLNRQ